MHWPRRPSAARRPGRRALDRRGRRPAGGSAHRARRDWRRHRAAPRRPTTPPRASRRRRTSARRVFVTTFGAEGIVRGVAGNRIDVDIRGKRLRVARRTAPRGHAVGGTGRSQAIREPGREAPSPAVSTSPAAPPRELVLIGSTVDDAIDRAEKFLDTALLGRRAAAARRARSRHRPAARRAADVLPRASARRHRLRPRPTTKAATARRSSS